jgi:hypothetical protein
VVGRPGSQCHRSRGAGGGFGAGDGLVAAVVDNVLDVDGGCAGVISDDTVGGGGDGRLQGAVVWVLESVVPRVVDSVCMLLLTRSHVRGSTHLPWPCFVSHTSHSAILPCSSPSFDPFS